MRLRVGAAFVSLALVAGSAFTVTNSAKKSVPPVSLMALRLGLGATALTTLTAAHRRSSLLTSLRTLTSRRSTPLLALALAVSNNVLPYTVYPIAMNMGAKIGIVALLAASSPLITTLATRDCSLPRAAALAAGSLGIAALYADALLHGGAKPAAAHHRSSARRPPSSASLVGAYSLVLLAAAGKAGGAVLSDLALSPPHAVALDVLAAAQTVAGALIGLILSLAIDAHSPPNWGRSYPGSYAWLSEMDAHAWAGVAYLGLAGSCLAYLLQFYLVAAVGPVRQIAVDFLVPIVASVEGAVFYHQWRGDSVESLVFQGIGMALVLVALAIIHVAGSPVRDETQDPETGPLLDPQSINAH